MYQQTISDGEHGALIASEPTVPLGHFATIVDILICQNPSIEGRNVIVTADRDEKIRVSQWPEAYEILSFCLGHKDFVSALSFLGPNDSLKSNYLLSGSGDGRIIAWDYENAKAVHDLSLDQFLDSSLVCSLKSNRSVLKLSIP